MIDNDQSIIIEEPEVYNSTALSSHVDSTPDELDPLLRRPYLTIIY